MLTCHRQREEGAPLGASLSPDSRVPSIRRLEEGLPNSLALVLLCCLLGAPGASPAWSSDLGLHAAPAAGTASVPGHCSGSSDTMGFILGS